MVQLHCDVRRELFVPEIYCKITKTVCQNKSLLLRVAQNDAKFACFKEEFDRYFVTFERLDEV